MTHPNSEQESSPGRLECKEAVPLRNVCNRSSVMVDSCSTSLRLPRIEKKVSNAFPELRGAVSSKNDGLGYSAAGYGRSAVRVVLMVFVL